MFIKLDDNMTPSLKRTRSIPQGDAYAAFFLAALDTPAADFCERCQVEMWERPVNDRYLGLQLFAGKLLDYRDVIR